MFDIYDVESGLYFKHNTSIDANVAVTTTRSHFRPSGSLGGRSLLSSYWGWISNHGIPGHRERNQHINNILHDVTTQEIKNYLTRYNITHIVVDYTDSIRFNMEFINSYAYRVASNGRYIIYEVVPAHKLNNPIDCGHNNEGDCVSHGCFWIPGTSNEPYCQVPPVIPNIDNYVPKDCGYAGITRTQCNDLGCSFRPAFVNGPYCQEAISLPHDLNQGFGNMYRFNAIYSKPQECGWFGINERQCQLRGCSWVPSSNPGDPWCVNS